MDERSKLVKQKVLADRPGGTKWTPAKMLSTVRPVPKSFIIDALTGIDDSKELTPSRK